MASIHAIRALESNTTASSDREVDLPRSSVSPFLGSEPLRAGLSGLACSAPPRGCPAHVVLATLLLQACGGFLPIAQSTPLADDGVEAVHVDATTQDQAMAQVSSGARMEQLAWFEIYGERQRRPDFSLHEGGKLINLNVRHLAAKSSTSPHTK